MSTHDNAPPPDDWETESRPCPIPCGICMTAAESVWLHGTDEHLIRGEN